MRPHLSVAESGPDLSATRPPTASGSTCQITGEALGLVIRRKHRLVPTGTADGDSNLSADGADGDSNLSSGYADGDSNLSSGYSGNVRVKVAVPIWGMNPEDPDFRLLSPFQGHG